MFPKHDEITKEFTYLSKTNYTQTILLVKEAQSYWQEQVAKELFEAEDQEDFLEQSKNAYQTNYILNDFANALNFCENSVELAIGFFIKMQQKYVFADIYDAVEDAFCFYLLSITIDINTYTDVKAKNALQEHYNEVYKIYEEIIVFVKSNKL